MYTWIAILRDGTAVPQHRADGSERSLPRDVDRAALARVVLIGHDGFTPVATVDLGPGQRLIYCRRNRIRSDGVPLAPVVVLGWQRDTSDGPVRAVGFYDETGTVAVRDFSESDALYSKVADTDIGPAVV